jgi:hypothetical protein
MEETPAAIAMTALLLHPIKHAKDFLELGFQRLLWETALY